MLPTHDIPAVRCEAAAPGVEVAVGGVACMDSMGPPRRVERTRRGIYLRGDQVSDDPISYTDDLLEKILAELVTIRTILLTTPR